MRNSIESTSKARQSADAEIGIAWWNAMNPRERADALRAAEAACPAEAWQYWRQGAAGFKCEETAHG